MHSWCLINTSTILIKGLLGVNGIYVMMVYKLPANDIQWPTKYDSNVRKLRKSNSCVNKCAFVSNILKCDSCLLTPSEPKSILTPRKRFLSKENVLMVLFMFLFVFLPIFFKGLIYIILVHSITSIRPFVSKTAILRVYNFNL